MNISIISLFTTAILLQKTNGLIPISPFFLITRPTILQLDKSIFMRFISPIICNTGQNNKIIDSNEFSISLVQDRFQFFLSNAIKLTSADYILINQKNAPRYASTYDTSSVTIKNFIIL